MNTQQTELSFNQNATNRKTNLRPQHRQSRARWWFNQMRLVVENAIDWQAAPPPPPEQTLLGLSPGK